MEIWRSEVRVALYGIVTAEALVLGKHILVLLSYINGYVYMGVYLYILIQISILPKVVINQFLLLKQMVVAWYFQCFM